MRSQKIISAIRSPVFWAFPSIKVSSFLVLFFSGFFSLHETAEAQTPNAAEISEDAPLSAQVNPILQTPQDNQPYNLKLGPVSIRASASFSTSFNDNINVSENGREADCILQPTLHLDANWNVTDSSALTVDFGAGYEIYLIHSGDSSLVLSPDSNAVFNFSVEDTQVSLHDSFSYQQNPIAVPQLSNTDKFPVFMNDAGIGLSWDLNDITPSIGYDHINQWVFDQTYDYLDYEEDSISPRLTFKITPTLSAGLNASFSQTTYDKTVENNNTSISGGPFVSDKLSDSLSLNAQAGYIMTTYGSGGSNGDTTNNNSYYASVGVSHRINDALTESLTAGRDYLPGLTSNFTQRTYADYNIGWQATTYFNASSNFSFQNLEDSAATLSEDSNVFQTGLTLSYAVTTHADVSLLYEYTLKDSNIASLSYDQNLVTAQINYQF
jgi:hypothetical protein